MAKTVDELVVKMSVEGQAQLTQATDNLKNIEKGVQSTANSFRAFNTRTLSANIQDIAVEAELGVNWMRILGQQGSEVLAAFGPAGAAAGAALAVGLAVARPVLSALGVDFRNLKEITDDLVKTNNAYISAQRENQTTLVGMGNSYGSLTGEAKKFFEVRQQLLELKSEDENSRAVKQLVSDYGFLTQARLDAIKETTNLPTMGMGSISNSLGIALQVQAKWLGLTTEQAVVLGEKLKGLDNSSPEKTVATITDILKYLKDAGPETDSFRRQFEKVIDPILAVNEQLIKSKINIKEAAEQASALNATLLETQNAYIGRIGDARRNFNQLYSFQLEQEEKLTEVRAQFAEKNKDGVDRSREQAAAEAKIRLESNEKAKDFLKTQSETVKSSLQGLDAKRRQLILESQILDIQDKGRYDAEYNLKYDEDIARASKEYNDTIISIAEQRRKNLITAEGEKQLQKEAGDLLKQSTDLAEQARNKRVKDIQANQENELLKKGIEDQIAGYQKLGDALRTINDQQVDIAFGRTQKGKSPLEQQIASIQENSRKAALTAARAYSQAFEDSGDGLSVERAQQLADGLKAIYEGYEGIANAQIDALGGTTEFTKGLTDSWDAFKTKAQDTAGDIKNTFDTFTTGMEDAFVKFAQTGKLSFSDLANSIVADLIRISVRKSIVGLGTLFGFAEGGNPPVGVPSIVGENGPEIFIPNTAGTIIPNKGNSNIPIGGANVTYNIQAVDASSFRSLVARDPQFIYSVTEQGRRSQPTRRLA
jgi:hypothetical protein